MLQATPANLQTSILQLRIESIVTTLSPSTAENDTAIRSRNSQLTIALHRQASHRMQRGFCQMQELENA